MAYIAAIDPKEFMSASTPATQRDVAEACGLHPSTVCLALKNSPSIPAATRQRIQSVAAALGYQPNVAARNLALLRTEKRSGGSLPLAWINQEARRDHWRSDPEARVYFEAARRRAEESGYHLEEIWTREPGMTPNRIVQILQARGIEGVVLPLHRSFDFSLLHPGWSGFALIGFNDQRLGEWVDVVCPDYYRNMDTALLRLRQLGCLRVGLLLDAPFDAATNGLAHSCYLRRQADLPAEDRVPVCFVETPLRRDVGLVEEWLAEHRPDAVIGRDGSLPSLLRGVGHEVPCVQLHGGDEAFDANMEPGAADIAAMAIACVVEKVRRFEKGVRESTRLHLVKGQWTERSLTRREWQTVVA